MKMQSKDIQHKELIRLKDYKNRDSKLERIIILSSWCMVIIVFMLYLYSMFK